MWSFVTYAAARSCWETGTPYATFPHGMHEPWSILQQGRLKYLKKLVYWRLFERNVFVRSSCSLYTSNRELEQAKRIFRFDGPARIVVPYGVVEARNFGGQGPAADIAALKGTKYVLFLGRLHPCKNVPLLLRAWKRAEVGGEWKLVIAGPSSKSYRNQLRRLAANLALNDRCVFLDYVAGADKAWLLRNAQWFVLPSEHENFGVAVFEAVASGCPVALSREVYTAELFEDHGRILPLDEIKWTEWVRRITVNEEYRKIVVDSDSKMIEAFGATAFRANWSELIAQLVSAAQPPATRQCL